MADESLIEEVLELYDKASSYLQFKFLTAEDMGLGQGPYKGINLGHEGCVTFRLFGAQFRDLKPGDDAEIIIDWVGHGVQTCRSTYLGPRGYEERFLDCRKGHPGLVSESNVGALMVLKLAWHPTPMKIYLLENGEDIRAFMERLLMSFDDSSSLLFGYPQMSIKEHYFSSIRRMVDVCECRSVMGKTLVGHMQSYIGGRHFSDPNIDEIFVETMRAMEALMEELWNDIGREILPQKYMHRLYRPFYFLQKNHYGISLRHYISTASGAYWTYNFDPAKSFYRRNGLDVRIEPFIRHSEDFPIFQEGQDGRVFTLQKGMPSEVILSQAEKGVRIVVPEPLIEAYPENVRGLLLSLDDLYEDMKNHVRFP